MKRIGSAIAAVFVGISLPLFLYAQNDTQLDQPPPEAIPVEQAAVNMQTSGEFAEAAKNWEQLVSKYPSTASTLSWRYNLGVCYHQLGRFAEAIDSFQKVVSQTDASFQKMDEAWLWCGFSQYKLAQQQSTESDNDAPKQAKVKELALSAARSFEHLIEVFPKSSSVDEAQYFCGEAYLIAGEPKKAIPVYDALVVNSPDSKFWPDAAYALGTTYEELGDLSRALINYDAFLDKFPEHASATSVRFRKAESLLHLAMERQKAGDKTEATDLFQQAIPMYEAVAATKGFVDADLAQYQIAYCLAQTNETDRAAKAFAKYAADFPKAKLAAAAQVEAGRLFLAGGDSQAAEQVLAAAHQNDPKNIAAARGLVRVYLSTDRADQARTVADQTWKLVDQSSDEAAGLLMDLGDAAFANKETVADSVTFYQQLAENFPKHALAPQALYNATFSLLLSLQPRQAIESAERFEKLYPKSSFLPDVREVQAEALVRTDQPAAAAKMLQQLIVDQPKNDKVDKWKVSLAQAWAMGDNPAEAESALMPLVKNLAGADKAETLFNLALAQFKAEKYAAAAQSLEQSLAADDHWKRVDEVLLLAARACFQNGDVDQARKYATRCLKEFPNSPVRDQVVYRMGEIEFETKQFDAANQYYTSLISDIPNSPLVPSALYGRGWSLLQSGDNDGAIDSFDKLLEKYPEHAFVPDATIARAIARRNKGDLTGAVADFNRYLKNPPDAPSAAKALYERGLTESKQKDWDAVIATFKQLLKDDGDSKSADRYHYELAWAFREKGNEDDALEQFRQIADHFADSPYAAESHFHLAEAAYDKDDMDAAIEHYTAAAKSNPDPSLAEKIAYKLGFSQYRQKDYVASEKQFRNQVEKFSDGALAADGLFMISESLYRQKKHADAVTAYKKSAPGGPSQRDHHPTSQDIDTATRRRQCQRSQAIRSGNRLRQSDPRQRFRFAVRRRSRAGIRSGAQGFTAIRRGVEGVGEGRRFTGQDRRQSALVVRRNLL